MIQHFIEVAVDYQNGVFEGIDGAIKQITGIAPQTIEQFVTANQEVFTASDRK